MNNADMPAMPVKPEYINNQPQVHEGLTKREYFAAMAMQGLLSAHEGHVSLPAYAKDAVSSADALLAELERTS